MGGRGRSSNAYSTTGSNIHFARLSEVKEALAAIIDNPRGDRRGIDVNDKGLKAARYLASKIKDPILDSPLPAPTQTEAEMRAKGLNKDYFTAALMVQIAAAHGNGAGIPFLTEGDGNCLLNAVAQILARKKQRGIRNDVKSLAAQLRLSIILEALRHMEVYLSRQEDYFFAWHNYVSDMIDKLRQKIQDCQQRFNAFAEAPADTDLDLDIRVGPGDQSAEDNSQWARTSMTAFLAVVAGVPIHTIAAVRYNLSARKPGHVLVFGADNFHLCSCMRLLRHGLPCRHFFAVLRSFIGDNCRGVTLNHTYDGNSVHNRWRKSPDGSDERWTVPGVLDQTGHGEGRDGCGFHEEGGCFWGPTYDDVNDGDGVHPSERSQQAASQRQDWDKRRLFASLSAKSKASVSEIVQTVPHDTALEMGESLAKHAKLLLHEYTSQPKAKNPAQVTGKGRPKGSKNVASARGNGGGGKGVSDPAQIVGNPEARHNGSRKEKRHRSSDEPKSGSQSKKGRTNRTTHESKP